MSTISTMPSMLGVHIPPEEPDTDGLLDLGAVQTDNLDIGAVEG